MPPASRIGDMHTCPAVTPGTPPIPHDGGPIITGVTDVLIGGEPAARVGDQATCIGPPDVIVRGSLTVIIDGQPASRIGDNTAHGGIITLGLPTVLIGDIGVGGFPLPITRLSDWTVQVGDHIVIDGDALFLAEVIGDIQITARYPTGIARLSGINSLSHNVTIRSSEGHGNETAPASLNDAAARGKPALGGDTGTGRGSDSTIYYDRTPRPTSANPQIMRPADIGLHHEMTHAERISRGAMDLSPDPAHPNNTYLEETYVIDQDNKYRDERGIPRRADHTTL